MLRKAALFNSLCAASNAASESVFVFEEASFRSYHASTIVETKPDAFLAAWFGGDAEASRTWRSWGSRHENERWSEPFEMVREPEIATYNPVLFSIRIYSKDRRLWLYYKFGPHPGQWTAGRTFSRDDGKTWSKPEHLPAGLYGPIRNKPLLLADGTIVSGTSVESYKRGHPGLSAAPITRKRGQSTGL
jgi:predicted neuraminidase